MRAFDLAPYDVVHDEAKLRALLGKPLPGVASKVLSRLPPHADLFLRDYAIGAVCVHAGKALTTNVLAPRAVRSIGGTALEIDSHEDGAPSEDAHVGTLFAIGGIGHTLRVNGKARRSGKGIFLEVEAAYFHCAKAFLRASLWSGPDADVEVDAASENAALSAEARRFLSACAFVLLGSAGPEGVDVSPRGDPAGFVRVLDDRTLLIPERPGNRLADTLRNVLASRRLSLLGLLPGSHHALAIEGSAHVVADAALLAASAVHGKVPRLGIVVHVERTAIVHHDTLELTWDKPRYRSEREVPSLGAMLADQSALPSRLTAAALDLVLREDEKRNLY